MRNLKDVKGKSTLITLIADDTFNSIDSMRFMLNRAIWNNTNPYDYTTAESLNHYKQIADNRSKITIQYSSHQENLDELVTKYKKSKSLQVMTRLKYRPNTTTLREMLIDSATPSEEFNNFVYILYTNFSDVDKVKMARFVSTLHLGNVYFAQYNYLCPTRDVTGRMVPAPDYVLLHNTEYDVSKFLKSSVDVCDDLYKEAYLYDRP